jgi:hypothetical protein
MVHIMRSDGAVLTIQNLTDQVYSMEADDGWQFHWSVSQARQWAEAHGELVIVSLSQMGATPERIRETYDGLDEEYAMTTDLLEPLIFVPFRGKDQLIDGHHRLYKAAVLGVDDLFAYVLPQEVADACLVCTFPPGQGVDWGQKSKHPSPPSSPNQRSCLIRRKRR